ncbi:class I SAM-dependent methyltransferase [Streptomyces sp. NPDC051453]|uniref:class I SAM-dependent methyltransferase n=1 Tax=Streptomyces sp. NPDC051453 TaxID=3154941 RepID=UPI003428246D
MTTATSRRGTRLVVPRPSLSDWESWYAGGGQNRIVGDREMERFYNAVHPGPGMAAADIGCGTGRWTRQLSRWGIQVTGYDFCAAALSQAEAMGTSEGLSYARWDVNVEPIPLALRPGSLDLITCRLSLGYFDVQRFINDAGRLLTPRGTFYALVPLHRVDRRPFKGCFHRGLAEDEITQIGVGWSHRQVYPFRGHSRAIVLRGYGCRRV